MKTRLRMIFLTGLLFCTACAASRPMSINDFRFRCSMLDGPSTGGGMRDNPCGFSSQKAICRAYEQALSQTYANRRECLAHCRAVRKTAAPMHAADGCLFVVDTGYNYCSIFLSLIHI